MKNNNNKKIGSVVETILQKSMSLTVRRVVIDATKPLYFQITKEHEAKAVCKDPACCVIAQALDEQFGDLLEGWQVGASITKVYTRDKVIRYQTSYALARAIPIFDKTGKWNLPPGEYMLRPPCVGMRLGSRPGRKAWLKRYQGSKRVMFSGRQGPTRRVIRADSGVKKGSKAA